MRSEPLKPPIEKAPKLGWLYTNGKQVVHVFYVDGRRDQVEFCRIPGVVALVLKTAVFNSKYPRRVIRFEIEEE
jgi:hypothetical protein